VRLCIEEAYAEHVLNIYAELDQYNLGTALSTWGNLPLAFQQELILALNLTIFIEFTLITIHALFVHRRNLLKYVTTIV
jgi:hypothetical protein